MKEVIKTSLSLFIKLLVVGFMCIIITISFAVLSNGLFSQTIGVNGFGTKEGSKESELLYTHYYAKDGEETDIKTYEEQGYTVNEVPIKELSKSVIKVNNVVTLLFCLMILISFVYPVLWDMGTRDSNLVKFKHKKEDKLKGLKIGLLTIIPSIILLLFVIITKNGILSDMPVALYKFINAPLYGFIEFASGKAKTLGDLKFYNFILYFIIQFIIPAITYGSYLLGYNNISIGEKIMYKKKKK